MPPPAPDVITPNRRTVIVFDEHLPHVLQPEYVLERSEAEIAPGLSGTFSTANIPSSTGVHRIPGIGWQLRPKGWDPDELHEADFSNGLIQSLENGLMTVAPNHQERNNWRQSGVLGVSYSGASTSGSKWVQKEVPSGASFEQRLSTDQSAYPGPDTASDRASMDRVAKGTEDHVPIEMITFRVLIPTPKGSVNGNLATLYFCGPASVVAGRTNQGLGQYALKLSASGRATLFERLVGGTWTKAFEFSYSGGPMPGELIQITITSDSRDRGDGTYRGSNIVFRCGTVDYLPTAVISNLVAVATSAIKEQFGRWPTYKVPGGLQGVPDLEPFRVDLRRDVLALFQVAKHAYPEEGTLVCNPIQLPIPPQNSTNPIYINVFGNVPPGTSLAVRMFVLNPNGTIGTALVGTETFSSELGVTYTFPPEWPRRDYIAYIDYTSDGEATPTVNSVTFGRNAVTAPPPYSQFEVSEWSAGTGPKLPRAAIRTISLTDQMQDPASESGTIVIDSYFGYLDFLKGRAYVPISIYNEPITGPGARRLLFRGHVEQVRYQELVTADDDNRFHQCDRFTLTALGEWAKAYRQLMPERFSPYNQDAQQPDKVTDVIKILLTMAGYGDAFEVPDLAPRIWAANASSATIEPGERCVQVAQELATDYLGGYLIWDVGIGPDYGKWRLLRPRRPAEAPALPFKPLAVFRMGHPGAGKLPHKLLSGETRTIEGREVPVCPILRGGRFMQPVWENHPPEANVITVLGAVPSSTPTAGTFTKPVQGEPTRVAATIINTGSFNVANDVTWPSLNLDSLPGATEVRIVDSQIPSLDAAKWMALRGYEQLCTGREEYTFDAPLIYITDPDDALQTRPRRLRFYDPVALERPDGSREIYLVRSCDVTYENDGFQRARYTIVRTTFMATVGSAMPMEHARSDYRRLVNRAQGRDARTPLQSSSQVMSQSDHAVYVALASAPGTDVQDLDATSPTFGQITWPSGYLDV